MAYHTLLFLCVFLPIVLIIYQLAAVKYRPVVLLAASYLFFFSFSRFLFVYLLGATVIIYFAGIFIEKVQLEFKEKKKGMDREEVKLWKKECTGKKRWILFFGILLLIGTLAGVKYYNFFAENFSALMRILSIPAAMEQKSIWQPIGISFYTLEAVGYMLDVYEEKIQAEHKFLKLALFLSFFPQMMEGPIGRYEQTADRLYEGNPLTEKNLSNGALRIFWGLFKKMLIADRLNWVVDTIYGNYQAYDGAIVALGAVSYTIQLYMEFSGSMDIVIGVGEMFGVTLPENFRQPLFSRNVSEFWRRWHITLGTWLKDYIFYPVSLAPGVKKLSAKAKKRFGKHCGKIVVSAAALFPVWLCNGLWHGPQWIYIFYGMYYFVLILSSIIFEPVFEKMKKPFKDLDHNPVFIGFQIARTLVLVFIGELFFRAPGPRQAVDMLVWIISRFHIQSLVSNVVLYLGIDIQDMILIIAALAVVFAVSCLHEKGIRVRDRIGTFPQPVRWCVYYGLMLSVLIFGAYGYGYTAVDLIYAGF